RLAGIGTTLLLFFLLNDKKSSMHAWSAIVYSSSLLVFALNRINITDGVLTFGMACTLLCGWFFIQRRIQGKPGSGALIGIGVGVAIAFLTKGLIAVVLPGLILFVWAAIAGRLKILFEIFFSRATIIALVLVLPWFILIERAHPGFSRFFFIH